MLGSALRRSGRRGSLERVIYRVRDEFLNLVCNISAATPRCTPLLLGSALRRSGRCGSLERVIYRVRAHSQTCLHISEPPSLIPWPFFGGMVRCTSLSVPLQPLWTGLVGPHRSKNQRFDLAWVFAYNMVITDHLMDVLSCGPESAGVPLWMSLWMNRW